MGMLFGRIPRWSCDTSKFVSSGNPPFALRSRKQEISSTGARLKIDCLANKKRISLWVIQRQWLMYPVSRRFMIVPVTRLSATRIYYIEWALPGIISRLSFSICRRACARALLRNRNSLFLLCAAIKGSIERLAIWNGRFISLLDHEIPSGFLRGCIFALSAPSFLVALAPSVSILAIVVAIWTAISRRVSIRPDYYARALILMIS